MKYLSKKTVLSTILFILMSSNSYSKSVSDDKQSMILENNYVEKIFIDLSKKFGPDYKDYNIDNIYKSKILNKKINNKWKASLKDRSFVLSYPYDGNCEEKTNDIERIFNLDFVYEVSCNDDGFINIEYDRNYTDLNKDD